MPAFFRVPRAPGCGDSEMMSDNMLDVLRAGAAVTAAEVDPLRGEQEGYCRQGATCSPPLLVHPPRNWAGGIQGHSDLL
jgi:hypothetical protein